MKNGKPSLARRSWDWLCSAWKAHGADIVKTAIGALIGATLAFSTERYVRNEEGDQQNLEAGLLVLATLEGMEQSLFANYCVNVLPNRNSKRPWLDLGSNPGDFPAPEPLDAPSLSFLLPDGGLEIYKELTEAQSAYVQYAEIVSRRNRLLWEVIYPVTDPLSKERASPSFDRRVADTIGTSPIEQAHQAVHALFATQRYVRVITRARSTVHHAMTDVFPDDVPAMSPELWPASSETPDCTVLEQDGYLVRVRRRQ